MLKLVKVEYIGVKRILVVEDDAKGGYYVREEGREIINANNPFMTIPETADIKKLFERDPS